MMQLYKFTFFLLLACVYACDDNDGNVPNGCDLSTRILTESKLNIVARSNGTLFHEVVSSRDSLLLILNKFIDPLPNAVDDEVNYTLFLPLAATETSFEWDSEDLQTRSVGIGIQCFCIPVIYPVRVGNISGTRTDDDGWFVSGRITLPEEVDDSFPSDVGGIYR